MKYSTLLSSHRVLQERDSLTGNKVVTCINRSVFFRDSMKNFDRKIQHLLFLPQSTLFIASPNDGQLLQSLSILPEKYFATNSLLFALSRSQNETNNNGVIEKIKNIFGNWSGIGYNSKIYFLYSTNMVRNYHLRIMTHLFVKPHTPTSAMLLCL